MYSITVYFNDSEISRTSISSSTGWNTSGYYGDNYISSSGFPDSSTCTFTAVPASGSTFSCWAYRLGSTSGTLQYSYSNPFTYTGGSNIYIRAISSGGGVQPVTTYTAHIYNHLSDNEGIASVAYSLSDGRSGSVAEGTYLNLTDIRSSTSISFTATPRSGYAFSYWLYRIGSDTNPLMTSYYGTFTHSTGEDIWIRPVSAKVKSGNLYVYNNGWLSVTPYIYDGSQWKECTSYLYYNGWREV